MQAKWFIRFLFVSLVLLLLASFASQNATVNAQATMAATSAASKNAPVNAQATMAATSAGAPPASKMRWDILSNTTKDGKPFLAPGGVASASANDGSYIVLLGTGTFGPGTSDPVTGGGTWTTYDANNLPTGNGKFTVTAFAGYDWGPGQLPPPSAVVDTIGNNADARSGVATLRIAYTNADGGSAGTGFLIISCHLPVGAPVSIVEGVVVSKGATLFYNPAHIVPGVDQGRNSFHIVH